MTSTSFILILNNWMTRLRNLSLLASYQIPIYHRMTQKYIHSWYFRGIFVVSIHSRTAPRTVGYTVLPGPTEPAQIDFREPPDRHGATGPPGPGTTILVLTLEFDLKPFPNRSGRFGVSWGINPSRYFLLTHHISFLYDVVETFQTCFKMVLTQNG